MSKSGDSYNGTNYPGALCDYAMCGGTRFTFYMNAQHTGIDGGNGVASLALDVVLTGSPPNELMKSWKCNRSMKDVTDGLSNTLLAGEKHVMAGGDGYAYFNTGADSCQSGDTCIYDNSFWNDNSSTTTSREAGQLPSRFNESSADRYPLARSPDDPTIATSDHMKLFGSSHSGGTCQFVLCDGSVQSYAPSIDLAVLAYLADIKDGEMISSGQGGN